MDRYICIHGHFYQPPRENPWLEAVERQDSAYPYHDWNERVTAECYAPNSASRILDPDNYISSIVNNYSRISFNFGPTLLAWMQQSAPSVYEAILTADYESRQRFSGHGSALAQAYNHMILPLANRRDRRTQVLWGLRDFEHRFGRPAEGFWLPETAVDLDSLEVLAEAGVTFTILAPHQAGRVRPIGGRAWRDVRGARIDPSMAYQIRLKSGRSLALFFYDGPISRAVAFEKLLTRGEDFAQRLAGAFSAGRSWTQLVHIATDGETYGHHHRHGDMALAYALHYIESHNLARLTNYGEYLRRHPPTHEVQIIEDTSWSCAHGVGRWQRDCGCNTGRGWRQHWRAPLREALDWLRDQLAPRYQRAAAAFFRDPWKARDGFIEVILDRGRKNVDRFLEKYAKRELQPEERVSALKLLELQRQAMLMYTSCGWFFDELSGIETVQVMQYAGRAVQLAVSLFGDGIEDGFLERLECAKSNLPEHGDGRRIYDKFVKPAMVDLQKVGAHYAVSSLFQDYPDRTRVYCHSVERLDVRALREGRTKLAVGRARITSDITGESADLTFGVLHLGDQNVSGGVREFRGDAEFETLAEEAGQIFHRGDIPNLIRAVDKHFGLGTYSIRLLFRDEQRKIVNIILEEALRAAAGLYRNFYSQYATLGRFVTDLGIGLPKRFQMAVDFTLNEDLHAAVSQAESDPAHVRSLVEQIERTGVPLDVVDLEFALRKAIDSKADALRRNPSDLLLLRAFERACALPPLLPFEVNLWEAQNVFFKAMQTHLQRMKTEAEGGSQDAAAWLAMARSLSRNLRVRVDAEPAPHGGRTTK